MTADDDNRMLKTSNEIATATFLLLFGVKVCAQFSLLTLYCFFELLIWCYYCLIVFDIAQNVL